MALPSLVTIPLDEGFAPKSGCPVCRLQRMVETRVIDFTSGSAMMEPDFRILVNRHGFCENHLNRLLTVGRRLSIALMLQSHLAELDTEIFTRKANEQERQKRLNDCIVCRRVEESMTQLARNIAVTFDRDSEFRVLVAAQQTLCLPHYHRLMAAGKAHLNRKRYGDFGEILTALCRGSLTGVRGEVDKFCAMFDYRNAEQQNGAVNGAALEEAALFLFGENGR